MTPASLEGDVVIVGGGPAGLTTAIALVEIAPRYRSRLVVLERRAYPREKICGGAVSARADRILRALDAEPRTPSVEIRGHSFRTSAGVAVAHPGPIARVIRRIEYDQALADAARARGVRIVDGVTVSAVRRRGGSAEVETSQGALHASVVVGADGVGSAVRRAMGLDAGRLRAQVVEVDTEPTRADAARDLLHFDIADPRLPGYAWDFPTLVDGRPLVCRGVYHLRRSGEAPGRSTLDINALLDDRLRALGLDPLSYPKKRFAERGYAARDRVALGPLLLVGEAAGVDPLTGEGIAQAVEAGALAGRFLAENLGSAREMDGYARVFARSRLSWDLRLRAASVALCYGRHRGLLEALVPRCPEILDIGGRHFGGLPWSPLPLAKVALAAAALAAEKSLVRHQHPGSGVRSSAQTASHPGACSF